MQLPSRGIVQNINQPSLAGSPGSERRVSVDTSVASRRRSYQINGVLAWRSTITERPRHIRTTLVCRNKPKIGLRESEGGTVITSLLTD